jgi:molecular chaperone DnaJ
VSREPADDLYALLELQPRASSLEIRTAFRRLAQVHHPDRPTGSAARMAAINRAYAVLGDPEQRRRYDASLAPAPTPEPASDAPPWQLDLDHGHDLADWQQMYAEERHVWEQLLASQSADHPNRAEVQAALARATREQLALENAIRRQAGQPPLTAAALDRQRQETDQAQKAATARAGCLTLLLPWR